MIIKEFEVDITPAKQKIDLGSSLPVGYSVGEVDGKLMLFVQLEEDYPGQSYIDVYSVETGQPFEKQDFFAGSVVMSTGSVVHVFTRSHYIRANI